MNLNQSRSNCGSDVSDYGKFICRVWILDCYTDPLGWKHRLKGSGQIGSLPDSSFGVTVFRDVRNLEKLLFGIIDLGKGIASFCTFFFSSQLAMLKPVKHTCQLWKQVSIRDLFIKIHKVSCSVCVLEEEHVIKSFSCQIDVCAICKHS